MKHLYKEICELLWASKDAKEWVLALEYKVSMN